MKKFDFCVFVKWVMTNSSREESLYSGTVVASLVIGRGGGNTMMVRTEKKVTSVVNRGEVRVALIFIR